MRHLWLGLDREETSFICPSSTGPLMLHRHPEIATLHALCDPVRYEFEEDGKGAFKSGHVWIRSNLKTQGWIYAIPDTRSGISAKEDALGRFQATGVYWPHTTRCVSQSQVLELWNVYLLVGRGLSEDFIL